MSESSSETVTVEVEVRGRPVTIEDVQAALDTLRREGIPDTFEVDITHVAEREYEKDVPYAERKVNHLFRMTASRAAATR